MNINLVKFIINDTLDPQHIGQCKDLGVNNYVKLGELCFTLFL